MFALRRLFVVPAAGGIAAVTAAQRRCVCDASQQPGYRMPPPEIATLADASPIPTVSVQPRHSAHVLYLHRAPMLTLEDVSAPVLKLRGLCYAVPKVRGDFGLVSEFGLQVAFRDDANAQLGVACAPLRRRRGAW